jgi:activator of 2-hydroxyglutaryl-CoA dehydratase
MAKTLEVGLDEIGPLSLSSQNPVVITNMCSIYAQIEVSFYIAQGADIHDIAAGINKSMAGRMKGLVAKVGVEEDLAITGGVAKNIGVVKYLEEMLGVEGRKFQVDPQIIGALGAALFARENAHQGGS